MRITWKPHAKAGRLTKRSDLPDSVFAFPHDRAEPMTNASHVRNAIARFDQVVGVTDEQRKLAFANIKKAAEHYGVDLKKHLAQLGSRPKTGRTAADRKASAKKAAATRKRSASIAPAAKKKTAVKKTAPKQASAKKSATRKKATAKKKTPRKTG
jgi:pyruvate/2-oxoglutarate dehydrogenase complex dihydrolipoamide acyltransferase (E2) component